MDNELIERVRLAARRSIELAGRSSAINHLADYVTDAVLTELAGELEDSRRIDALQEIFIKGEEFHIVMCEGKNEDEQCEHDTHPHFEAFDWSWRGEPARASTLRGVIDKAIDEARG